MIEIINLPQNVSHLFAKPIFSLSLSMLITTMNTMNKMMKTALEVHFSKITQI